MESKCKMSILSCLQEMRNDGSVYDTYTYTSGQTWLAQIAPELYHRCAFGNTVSLNRTLNAHMKSVHARQRKSRLNACEYSTPVWPVVERSKGMRFS